MCENENKKLCKQTQTYCDVTKNNITIINVQEREQKFKETFKVKE